MKLIPLESEEELTKFCKENCMRDTFLRYLFNECNKRIISYAETESNIDFGMFIEIRGIFRNYLTYKYDVMLFSVNLTNYFCNLNNLDILAFYGSCD